MRAIVVSCLSTLQIAVGVAGPASGGMTGSLFEALRRDDPAAVAAAAHAVDLDAPDLASRRVTLTSPRDLKGGGVITRQSADEDGTWFVQTRAFGFQPYFETGFPFGRSQFISTAATAWAATALAYGLE